MENHGKQMSSPLLAWSLCLLVGFTISCRGTASRTASQPERLSMLGENCTRTSDCDADLRCIDSRCVRPVQTEEGPCPPETELMRENSRGEVEQYCGRRTGEKHGRYRKWHENGNRHTELYYWNGKAHGLYRMWHENGTRIFEGSYVHGEKHGIWSRWHHNGHMLSHGQYRNGRKHGKWEFRDNTGTLKRTAGFLDGDYNGTWIDWDEQGQQLSCERWDKGMLRGPCSKE